jgi:hypothetical protein
MQTFKLAATERSPEIVFDFPADHLAIRGESYPEDVSTFYGPVFDALEDYLAGLGQGHCRFDFELVYFNSSSAKIIMIILQKLEEAARRGAQIDVHWKYDGEDDTMEELGQEFAEDLRAVRFHMDKMAA